MSNHINNLPPVGDFNDYQKGQRALTMLLNLPSFSGSPVTRFDRWIKLFENVVAMSNWTDEEKVNMLITKMTDKAHDILQNILESYTVDYEEIKGILYERFHGNETEDFYQKKFDKIERKPQETILDYAFRLKTIFQRAYPTKTDDTAADEATRLKFLRQKFLQGFELSLRNKIRHKTVKDFEEFVSETEKYAIRTEEDKDEKEKREFVNAVSKPTETPEIKEWVAAIGKQCESINSFANNFKHGPQKSDNSPNKQPETNEQLKKLTEAMAEFLNSTPFRPKLQYDQRPQAPFPFPNKLHFPNGLQQNYQTNQFRPNFVGAPQQNRFAHQNRSISQQVFQQPQQNPYRQANFLARQMNPGLSQNTVTCNFCGHRGHTQDTCKKMQQQAHESGHPPICYNCRGIGHIARNCNMPPNQNRPNIPGSQRNQENA